MKSKYTFNEIEELLDKTSKLKISDVTVSDLLTNGKKIATIHIDNFDHNLYAPSTYAWDEITSKPTTLEGYGIIDAIRWKESLDAENDYKGAGYGYYDKGWKAAGPALSIGTGNEYKLQINLPFLSGDGKDSLYFRSVYNSTFGDWLKILDSNNYASVLNSAYLKLSGGYIKGNVTIEGRLSLTEEILMRQHYLFVRPDSDADWVVTTKNWGKEYSLLHAGNYESIVGNKFLKLSGGEMTGSLIVGRTDSSAPLCVTNSFTPYTAIAFRGSTLKTAYLIYSGTGDTWEVTNEGWSRTSVLLHANNFNTYALPITGGTISGALTIQSGDDGKLIFDNTDTETYWGLIYFKQNGETYGRFGTQGTTDLSWNSNLILHSGNIGDFAFVPRTGIINNTDADTLLTNGVYLNATGNGSGNSNFPSTYSILMTFTQNSNYAAQLSVAGNAVHIRRKIDAWSDWKTVAFTDSNVASATKLQTARTIWGQSFDGTADVSGDLFLATKNNDGNALSAKLVFTGYGGLYYGPIIGTTNTTTGGGFGHKDLVFLQHGSASWPTDASSHIEAMRINCLGNVTIGTGNWAGTTWRLFVDKSAMFQAYNNAMPTLGSPAEAMVHIGQEKFGMQLYATYGGNGVIQSGRIDGTATAYNLDLQPLGGDVNVGANLKVGGRMAVGGATDDGISALQVNGDASIAGGKMILNSGAEGIYITGNTISWHNASNVWSYSSIGFYPNQITLYQYVNASSRVTINGASDDGVTALQVNGDIVIPNYTAYKAYDTNGGKMNLMYLDTSNRLRVYNDTMSFTPQAKVGIGTATPDEKLHVVGNLHVTGNIIADGQVSSGQSITFVDANGNNHVLSGDDTAGGLKIDDKIITVN